MLYNHHNLNIAKLAAPSTSSNEVLKAVFFTHDKTVATDGYRLIEVSTPKDAALNSAEYPEVQGKRAMRGVSPFLVSADAVREIKFQKKTPLPVAGVVALAHVDDKRVDMMQWEGSGGRVLSLNRIDGQFPDYAGLFPSAKGEKGITVTINAKYLREVVQLMENIDESTHKVKLTIYGEGKPIELAASHGDVQHARALVMPMKE